MCRVCRDELYVVLLAVLTTLCLTICSVEGASTSGRSEAYAKAQAAKKSGGSNILSSYFRRNPYGPNTYAFGYEVNDKPTGNVQFRDERRYVNGSVEGSFGYVRPDGRVIVTHFLADDERGFLHETETFEIGEYHKWQAHWPTKRPDILMQRPQDVATGNVVYDKDLHLNVTSGKVPNNVAEAVQQQHGLDVNKVDQTDVINSSVLDIINGQIPLQQKPNKMESSMVGFEAVNNFIPPDFPIVPFQLPEMSASNESNVVGLAEGGKGQNDKQENEQADGEKLAIEKVEMSNGASNVEQRRRNKYDRAKMNNAEKSISAEAFRKSADNAAAQVKDNAAEADAATTSRKELAGADQPKPLTADNNRAWYEQIIHDTRNDFLQNLPSLV